MMRNRADIHFHLLPGVDDGAATIDDSLELARAAVADGTAIIVATPHVRHDFVTDVGDLPDRLRELRDALAEEAIGVEVVCGAELGHDMVGRLGQRDLETIAVGSRGARWLLLEAPFEGSGEEFHLAAEELRDRGFGIVLAHPERSPILMADGMAWLAEELRAGALLQVNAWSLAGGYGAEAERHGRWLVRLGLATCLASDAHPGWRGPALTLGLDWASEILASARILTDSAPRALVEHGAPIPARALRQRADAA